MMLKHNVKAYWLLMRADKPIGIYLLLWPTMWAVLIAANGQPPLGILSVFVLGVIVMRSAGCVINDYADRHVDGSVERTKARPIVAGLVSEKEALLLFFFLISVAFLLVLTLNFNTVLLSIGAVLLATIYPFMKRYTHLPQVVLGAAFSWAIPMAFMAIQNQVPAIAWLLYLANLLWTVAYDTQYAMVDRKDDLQVGVKSTAVLFGSADKLVIGLLQFSTGLLLISVAWLCHFSWPVYAAVVIVACFFGYQQWLIAQRQPARCFSAFLNNHWVGLIFTLGLVCHYALQRYAVAA